MSSQPARPRRIWLKLGLLLLVPLLALAAYVFYNPFWLIDRGVGVYLRTHSVQSRFMDVDGYRVHYLEAAPGRGQVERPLVLVHGLGARAGDWAPLIPSLAASGYHVYALDLLGYGDSEKPAGGDFTLRGEERLLFDFMRTLHVKNADIGGWSMGGWISMLFALDHPEAVRRLLLFDSAGLYFNPDFDSRLFSPQDKAGLEKLVARIEPDTPFIRLPSFAVPGLVRRMQANRWIVDQSFRSMISGREVLDFRLQQLTMPVLIVWGTEDKLTPYEQGQRLHQLLSQSVLVGFSGCGHLAAAECSRSILPVVKRFLAANPPLLASESVVDGRPQRK